MVAWTLKVSSHRIDSNSIGKRMDLVKVGLLRKHNIK